MLARLQKSMKDKDKGSSIAAFTASDGNTVKLTKTAVLGEYCISASNEGSSEPTKFIKYLSDAGGLQKEFTTTCA
jgi:hypothetical protein